METLSIGVASGCASLSVFVDDRWRLLHLKSNYGIVKMNTVNQRMPEQDDLKVFITSIESTCDECKEDLGSKAWITLTKEKGALCLSCADLDNLVFLPSGDAALTRRARKHSTLTEPLSMSFTRHYDEEASWTLL